jgi:hypothetical protein
LDDDDIVLGMASPSGGASAAGGPELPVLAAEPRAAAEPRPASLGSPPNPEFADSTLVRSPSQDLIDQTIRDPKQELEEMFQRVYHDFVELKRKCGESIDSVTFERFVGKLRDNRDQLMRKLGCKSVRFQVYVKDGKAALKATPVRD